MTSAEMVVVGMKHIVCFSGGHSSAIAAVEVVRKFGAEDTILLNHDLCPRTEDADIKRFKKTGFGLSGRSHYLRQYARMGC